MGNRKITLQNMKQSKAIILIVIIIITILTPHPHPHDDDILIKTTPAIMNSYWSYLILTCHMSIQPINSCLQVITLKNLQSFSQKTKQKKHQKTKYVERFTELNAFFILFIYLFFS